jgi:cell division protein FtsB
VAADPVVDRAAARAAGARRTAGLTTRAIALAVVLLILTISYASSLRVYLNQRQDIAATQQQIIRSQQRIGQLSDEISRWNDPNYVKTQARVRLGWVMPGETGYRVIGPDGKTITGENEIAADQPAPKPHKPWYDKMWGSVETADKPRPVTSSDDSPADEPPITQNTKPSASPSR